MLFRLRVQLYIRLSNGPLLAREGVRLEPVAVAASCHKTNLRLEICVWNYKSIPGEEFLKQFTYTGQNMHSDSTISHLTKDHCNTHQPVSLGKPWLFDWLMRGEASIIHRSISQIITSLRWSWQSDAATPSPSPPPSSLGAHTDLYMSWWWVVGCSVCIQPCADLRRTIADQTAHIYSLRCVFWESYNYVWLPYSMRWDDHMGHTSKSHTVISQPSNLDTT